MDYFKRLFGFGRKAEEPEVEVEPPIPSLEEAAYHELPELTEQPETSPELPEAAEHEIPEVEDADDAVPELLEAPGQQVPELPMEAEIEQVVSGQGPFASDEEAKQVQDYLDALGQGDDEFLNQPDREEELASMTWRDQMDARIEEVASRLPDTEDPFPPSFESDQWWRAVVIDGQEVGYDDKYPPQYGTSGLGPTGYYIEELLGRQWLSDLADWPTTAPASRTRDANGAYKPTIILADAIDGITGFGDKNFWTAPMSTSAAKTVGMLLHIPTVQPIAKVTLATSRWLNYYVVGFDGTVYLGANVPVSPHIQTPQPCYGKYTNVTPGSHAASLMYGAYDVPTAEYDIEWTIPAGYDLYPTPAIGDVVPIMPVYDAATDTFKWYDLTPRIVVKTGTWGATPDQLQLDTALDTIGRLWTDTT
uniref:Uncharacterized protein n=1 Tax=viral metagenome TaxID=1070528 RepID=A0A6M3JQ79_9ZZZZ